MHIELRKTDEELKESFFELKTIEDLGILLEVDFKTLVYYLYRLSDDSNYSKFSIPKKSGGERLICAPKSNIKILQKKLNYILQLVYIPKKSTHGFVKNRSIVSNAQKHINGQYVLNIDLTDFFPSITFPRIYGLFHPCKDMPPVGHINFPKEVAAAIAKMCCCENRLPQGAPTSPVISNMICRRMDGELENLAKKYRCTYSRYADDITFSTTQKCFPKNLAYHNHDGQTEVGEALQNVITNNFFAINPKKVRLSAYYHHQEVTGITVNQKTNLKRSYYRLLRSILYKWKVEGIDEATRKFYNLSPDQEVSTGLSNRFNQIVLGKLNYYKMVVGKKNASFVKLALTYNNLSCKDVFPVEEYTEMLDFYEKATWIIENDPKQGTGFSLSGYGIITCRHVLSGRKINDTVIVYLSKSPDIRHEVKIKYIDPTSDFAILKYPEQYDEGNIYEAVFSEKLSNGYEIVICGFPRYTKGDGIYVNEGKITMTRSQFVKKYIISQKIVYGNSGGPVFNKNNKVIGIVVTGSKSFNDESNNEDFEYGFIPIDIIKIYDDFR